MWRKFWSHTHNYLNHAHKCANYMRWRFWGRVVWSLSRAQKPQMTGRSTGRRSIRSSGRDRGGCGRSRSSCTWATQLWPTPGDSLCLALFSTETDWETGTTPKKTNASLKRYDMLNIHVAACDIALLSVGETTKLRPWVTYISSGQAALSGLFNLCSVSSIWERSRGSTPG